MAIDQPWKQSGSAPQRVPTQEAFHFFALVTGSPRLLNEFMHHELPRVVAVEQKFPVAPPFDLEAALANVGDKLAPSIRPGAAIAVAVGSRGIDNVQAVVRWVVTFLQRAGARPFIVPAMGSHGGATPEGQTEVLASYGVTEQNVGAPVRASVEVERLGTTAEGTTVFFSREAQRADGIVIINRVKPHTDFSGKLGSGILKMIVVGLGKRTGATAFHGAASRLGYERVLRSIAAVTIEQAPILGGIALIENQFHQTCKVAWLSRHELERQEESLFAEAKALMPQLPFPEIDFLIVDRLGKNISGAGMDPNIIGRGVQGYSSSLAPEEKRGPVISRIFVRDLTPESHGNAIGIGLADLTTSRLVRGIDKEITYINALTSLTPHAAKIPIHFETDREAIQLGLDSLALSSPSQARIVRIADTLSLATMEVSESYLEAIQQNRSLALGGEAHSLRFDAADNLLPIGQ